MGSISLMVQLNSNPFLMMGSTHFSPKNDTVSSSHPAKRLTKTGQRSKYTRKLTATYLTTQNISQLSFDITISMYMAFGKEEYVGINISGLVQRNRNFLQI